jgi:hypothetical protein
VINLDATLGQQLLDISVGKPVAQVPSHREHDHIRREPETSEARPRHWYSDEMTTHQPSLPDLVTPDATARGSGFGRRLVAGRQRPWSRIITVTRRCPGDVA